MKLKRKVENLEDTNLKLIRKKRSLEKRIERFIKKPSIVSKINTPEAQCVPLTPNSKTRKEMREMGLSPRKHPAVRKKLLYGNILSSDLRKKLNLRPMKKSELLANRLMKKYRCSSIASRELKVDRRTFKRNEKGIRSCLRRRFKEPVEAFLEREDNCTVLPGKKDTMKVGTELRQKRVLCDYLHNLHTKILLENPDMKISRAVFCRLRPRNILTANFASRTTCLCSRHQNMALKIRALRNVGIQCPKTPDAFIRENCDDDIRKMIDGKESIKFMVWMKVQTNDKFRWKMVEKEMRTNDFAEMFLKEVDEFRGHVERVKNQYEQMKLKRESLKNGEVFIWMDFAENFTSSAVEEVQSAYWNPQMMTLHTMVIYFPKGHDVKSHKSVVAISDVLQHNATMVYSIINSLIPFMRIEYPELKTIHYLTDSPTSQYRNKTIFQLLSFNVQLNSTSQLHGII